ncbi:DUF1508 domain-containing protein [Sedimentitalea sp. JM2-8]|uniref:DUF1508 domain-containing protein n=1 Tax=Sedimentitalea xiamensis TaxID=3050037 RepID=A0ABT7FIV3_9RHOB|nr:DUF1508 domain-containing protein [Sedimentitalea xiamensis]MDK3075067.1 DUF1508 domain-containing protein [Sedimentitalea xiamensis]
MYFKLYKDVSLQWRWTLKAANHQTIADSAESYWNKSDAIHGINLVRASSQAPIYEQ